MQLIQLEALTIKAAVFNARPSLPGIQLSAQMPDSTPLQKSALFLSGLRFLNPRIFLSDSSFAHICHPSSFGSRSQQLLLLSLPGCLSLGHQNGCVSSLVNSPLAADHRQGGGGGRRGGRCKAGGPTLSREAWQCFCEPPLSPWRRRPATSWEPSESRNKGSAQPANALLASACVSERACCAC